MDLGKYKVCDIAHLVKYGFGVKSPGVVNCKLQLSVIKYV